jgi:thioredoxin reductase (NADPH)
LIRQRLFGNSKLTTDYDNVPTTVFSPLEYGCCGLSEEDAVARCGADNIEVFHSFFTPLEFEGAGRNTNECYVKLVCLKTEEVSLMLARKCSS